MSDDFACVIPEGCTCTERSQFYIDPDNVARDGEPPEFGVWSKHDTIAVCTHKRHAELIATALNALSGAGRKSICALHGVGKGFEYEW